MDITKIMNRADEIFRELCERDLTEAEITLVANLREVVEGIDKMTDRQILALDIAMDEYSRK
jgi:hypothetical protein